MGKFKHYFDFLGGIIIFYIFFFFFSDHLVYKMIIHLLDNMFHFLLQFILFLQLFI